jgi:hypothetical protein
MVSREYVAHTINLGLIDSLNARPSRPWRQQQPGSAAWQATASTARAPNVTRADVVAVAAMEGVGLAEAVTKYNLLAAAPRAVPFTNVRAMSNWLHQPLRQVRAAGLLGQVLRRSCPGPPTPSNPTPAQSISNRCLGLLRRAHQPPPPGRPALPPPLKHTYSAAAGLLCPQVSPGNWTYGEEVPEDFENGYGYAIATGSSYILALFRQRCQDQRLQGAGPARLRARQPPLALAAAAPAPQLSCPRCLSCACVQGGGGDAHGSTPLHGRLRRRREGSGALRGLAPEASGA